MTRFVAAWWAVMVMAALSVPARAQVVPLPSAGSPGLDGGHGWVVVPRDFDRFSLVHLPPRSPGLSTRDDSAPSGTVRQVMSLSKPPMAMAAVDQRVVLVYEPSIEGPELRWPVRSVQAQAMGQGTFRYLPKTTSGGFAVEPSLVAQGRLSSVVGAIGRVFALVGNDQESGLWVLGRDAWTRVEMPEFEAGVRARRLLEGHPDRLALLDSAGGVWLGRGESEQVVWKASDFRVPVDDNELREGRLVWLGDGPGRWRVTGDRVEFDRFGSEGLVPAANADAERSRVGVVPMIRDGRVALLWPAEPKASNEPMLVEEVSVWTGQGLYKGQVVAGGPVSTRDFRVLALAMLGISIAVLVFAIRQPASEGAVTLPWNTALAAPGHRLSATLVDWVMIATVSATVLDTPLMQTLTLTGLVLDPVLRASGGLLMALGVLGIAWAWGTVFESALGATPGKWLVGLRVVRVKGEGLARRPGFVRSAVRNAFKWGLLPWAAAEAMSPGVRHRGDQVAGAAVVVELEED